MSTVYEVYKERELRKSKYPIIFCKHSNALEFMKQRASEELKKILTETDNIISGYDKRNTQIKFYIKS